MNKERLKPFVNDPILWQAWLEYVEEKINTAQKTLNAATGLELIYREQGKIHALYKLLSLRDEVNGPNNRQESLFK